MSTTADPFKSRFGHHPCDYRTYQKLKALHRAYWQTVYHFHRWHRWWRKQPENRRGSEPVYCPCFVLDEVWYKPVVTHGVPGFMVYPRRLVDHGVIAWYHAARTPLPEPPEPFDAATLAAIESVCARVEQSMPG
jgi:hypothetical protein